MSYVADILDEHQQLATARLPWETHWRDIAKYVLPQTEGFDTLISSYPMAAVNTVVSAPVAADKSKDLYDMTSLWAIERLTAGLLSLKTPETQNWHDNQLDDPFGADPTYDEEIALERLRDYQFRVRSNPKSGFWPSHRSALKSMCGFGDGWQFIEEITGHGVGLPYRYSHVPIIEAYPGLDPNGQPNRMFRPFAWSCEQVVRKFGADKVSKTVLDKANDAKSKHNKVSVLHAVRPRDQSDQYAKLGNRGAAFASCYILPDDKHLIGESGFFEFPFVRYAWSNSGLTPYSTGPVAYAIGELKSRHRRMAEIVFAGEPPRGLHELDEIELVERDGNRLVLSLEGDVTPLLRFLGNRDDLVDILLSPPRLEDIFLGFYDTHQNGHGDISRELPVRGEVKEAVRR